MPLAGNAATFLASVLLAYFALRAVAAAAAITAAAAASTAAAAAPVLLELNISVPLLSAQALQPRGRSGRVDVAREPVDVAWLSQAFAVYRDAVGGNKKPSLSLLNLVREGKEGEEGEEGREGRGGRDGRV